MTVLETASMARSEAPESEDDDDVSLAYMSVTHSPSDVSSINGVHPPNDDEDGHVEQHTGARGTARRSKPSLVSLRGAVCSVDLFARENIGVLVNFVAVGIVHGVFQSIAYPLLKIYLNMDEYEAYSAERWMALPWMFKFVFAFLSDVVAIKGRRRKPYMYMGWMWCLLFSLILVVAPSAEPYWKNGQVVNGEAASAGGRYAAMFTLATIGYVLVDTVCDGWMVQFAHLERSKNDGDLNAHGSAVAAVVTTLQAAKWFGQMGATFVVALLCNGEAYGGSFGWSPSVNIVMVLSVLVCVAALLCTRFFLVEEEDLVSQKGAAPSLRESVDFLWQFAQQRVVWQVVLYTFITRVCFSYYATSAKAIYEFWLTISPLSSTVFSAINFGVYGGVAVLFQQSFLLRTMRWRRIMVLSVVASIFMIFLSTIFTVFNVVRSPFLTLTFEQLTSIFEASAYYIVLFFVAEVAERGYECFTYTMILTAANLGVPFAASLSQSIGARFDVYDDEYTQDTSHVRGQVMYCFLVMFLMRALSLAALPLLPDHATHVCELKRLGGDAKRLPAICVGVTTGLLLGWASLMTLLASFETTACLTVAGGEGC